MQLAAGHIYTVERAVAAAQRSLKRAALIAALMDPPRLTMFSSTPNTVLTPAQALARYRDALTLSTDGRTVVMPGLIATLLFERGSTPAVRPGVLACFDRYAELYGEHLKGGKDSDLGKFSKRTAKGIELIRRAISETPSWKEVSVVRSSATDQDTAAEYAIASLTATALPEEYVSPTGLRIAKGQESGLSCLKFHVPMDSIACAEALTRYEEMLRFVCAELPVRGGYGGLSTILPFSFHPYMQHEWTLAQRFSGLEIDSHAFSQNQEYDPVSYEGESLSAMTAFYDYLKPGAKVGRYGYIKGVNWYTVLGELFVERMGGEGALRASLARADIAVERAGECLLIRAGEVPRLGAPEEGLPEPYVFVNSVVRVLRNPAPDALHTYVPDLANANAKETSCWAARFDLPGAAPLSVAPATVPEMVASGNGQRASTAEG
ncbi:type VI immunity family protein [Paraburkholderia sp.]|uniref:type VI immunity family protein n=1 Tax=Paraburkholderia sp. TaxID=1926495 RepID=UPI002B48EF43|nr:type VI immunity family protein [Paraburkholderia sp.]